MLGRAVVQPWAVPAATASAPAPAARCGLVVADICCGHLPRPVGRENVIVPRQPAWDKPTVGLPVSVYLSTTWEGNGCSPPHPPHPAPRLCLRLRRVRGAWTTISTSNSPSAPLTPSLGFRSGLAQTPTVCLQENPGACEPAAASGPHATRNPHPSDTDTRVWPQSTQSPRGRAGLPCCP